MNVIIIKALHQHWINTDHAWSAEIGKAYPRQHPGNVRYTVAGKGALGTPLRAAYEARQEAERAFNAAGGFDELFRPAVTTRAGGTTDQDITDKLRDLNTITKLRGDRV